MHNDISILSIGLEYMIVTLILLSLPSRNDWQEAFFFPFTYISYQIEEEIRNFNLPVRCSCCCSLLCLFPMAIFDSLLNVIFINRIQFVTNQFSFVLQLLHTRKDIHTYLLRFSFLWINVKANICFLFFLIVIRSWKNILTNEETDIRKKRQKEKKKGIM